MATLEKIRSKSVLLLIIVGAALLAFIIGDFFTSGRTLFGTGTTIAKVGDQKVDVQEFQRRVQQASEQAQQSGQRVDQAVLQQQVLDALIAEKLFNKEVEQLGLVVTDSELSDMMVGKNSAYVDRMVQQQIGAPDAATAHDMAFNPSKYGIPQDQAVQLQQYWLELEKSVEQMLLQQKFQTLFAGVLQANDLDAQAIYDENAPTANVVFAKKDLASVDDEEYEVGQADINAIYNSEKERYVLDQPVRRVSYIAVNILPSQEDLLNGQKQVEDAIVALNEKPEGEGIADMPAFLADRKIMSQGDIDKQPRLKAALDTMSVGNARLVSREGNNYTIAKLLDKSQRSDKVVLDFMAVQGSRAQIDSLTALLNAGASFDSVAASPLVAQSQKGMDVSLLDANASAARELIAGRATGVYFAPDTLDQGGRIIRIAELSAPTTVYDFLSVAYTTEPSAATVNELESALQAYVAAHSNPQQFTDSAQAAGYTAFPYYVTASSPSLGNISDTHDAVAWVMDAKKGQVSPIFGDLQNGHFLAVALEDVYNDYTPASDPQIKQELRRRAVNNKKAAALIAEYQGKAQDIAGYARLMATEPDTTTINFGQQFIPGLGMAESVIQGQVAAAKPGQVVGPVQSNNAVVVFEVTGVDNQGRPYSREENAVRYEQQRGASRLGANLPAILRGKQTVKNNICTFYK